MKLFTNHVILALTLVLLCGCGNSGIDREDVAATNYADIPNDSVQDLDYTNSDQWMNEYITANPDMSFAFVRSDTGRYKTVAGNYTVVMDNVDDVQSQAEVYKFFTDKFDSREKDRIRFNEGIDEPAVPEKGYPEYLSHMDSLIDTDNFNGTVFVDVVIDESGDIDNAEIVDGIYGRSVTDSVSIKVLRAVLNSGQKWKPAVKDGQPTSMRIEIPVHVGKG